MSYHVSDWNNSSLSHVRDSGSDKTDVKLWDSRHPKLFTTGARIGEPLMQWMEPILELGCPYPGDDTYEAFRSWQFRWSSLDHYWSLSVWLLYSMCWACWIPDAMMGWILTGIVDGWEGSRFQTHGAETCCMMDGPIQFQWTLLWECSMEAGERLLQVWGSDAGPAQLGPATEAPGMFDELGMEDNFLSYLETLETRVDMPVASAVISADMMSLELVSTHPLIDLYGQTQLVVEPNYCNLQCSAAAARDPACQIAEPLHILMGTMSQPLFQGRLLFLLLRIQCFIACGDSQYHPWKHLMLRAWDVLHLD